MKKHPEMISKSYNPTTEYAAYPQDQSGFTSRLQGQKPLKMTPKAYTKNACLSVMAEREEKEQLPCRE